MICSANYHAIPEELSHSTNNYNHIGDIDVLDGIIYGGLEGREGNGILAAWHASNLTFIRHTVTQQRDMPWVAVHADSRKIYSAVWGDCCEFQIYDLDSFEFSGTLTVPNGLPKEIQGGAFYNGDLYVTTNINVSVYKVNIVTGDIEYVLSDDYIDNHIYEMEGIDFWDLEDQNIGTMHM